MLPKCNHRTIAGGLFLRGSECLDARPLVPKGQSKDIGRWLSNSTVSKLDAWRGPRPELDADARVRPGELRHAV